MRVLFRWDTQQEEPAKALLVWHDLCEGMCDLESEHSIVFQFESHVTKKKELVSHLFYTARDILARSDGLSRHGFKAAVEEALNELVLTDVSKKRSHAGGEPEEKKKKEKQKEMNFKDWNPLVFERCSDFLVSLLKIKIGSFPRALSTGDWKNLFSVGNLYILCQS